MQEVVGSWEDGIHAGGRKINNLRYADDTVIIFHISYCQKLHGHLDSLIANKSGCEDEVKHC